MTNNLSENISQKPQENEGNNTANHDRELQFDKMVEEQKNKTKKDSTDLSNSIRFGNYVVDLSGLYYHPIENNEKDQKPALYICSPIWPEAYLRDPEGKNHTLLVKVWDGEKFHLWSLPRPIIAKLADLCGILLDLGQHPPVHLHLQRHLQIFLINAKPTKKMRCVDKAGWHEKQYIFSDGQVIGKIQGDEGIFPVIDAKPRGVGQKGTLEDWQKNVLSQCVDNTRLIFAIGTAFASMCLHYTEDDNGGFNFKGHSSIGKTKTLKVAISAVGAPDYIRSWKATANGLEGVCALHNDSLLALDEFGQSDAKEIGCIAYMISAGIGKQRAAKDGSPREPRMWRVMLLSTGEIGLEDHMRTAKQKTKAGQLTRVIDIPADASKGYGCFENIHGYKDGADFADAIGQAYSESYGTAARAFALKLTEYGDEHVRRDLQYAIDDFVADNTKSCDGQVKRVCRRFGIVYAALLLANHLEVLGDLLPNEMIEGAVKKCYFAWLTERGTKGDIETHRLVEQVKGLLFENADSKFISGNDTEKELVRSTLWGYKYKRLFYLLPKAFKEQLCEGYDHQQAIKSLISLGILMPGSNGKSSKTERIPAHHKQPDRFYVIDLSTYNDENEDNKEESDTTDTSGVNGVTS